jgi:hypothetical protein
MSKAAQTGAFNELTRGMVDNVTRFSQEYFNSVTASMARTQNFMTRQVEQGSRQFTQIANQATDEVAEAGQRSSRTATSRNGRKTK